MFQVFVDFAQYVLIKLLTLADHASLLECLLASEHGCV